MKVLHVHSGNLYGGIETMLTTLARYRHLCPDMEPAFALCFAGRLAGELAETGVEVADLGPVRARWPWTVLRARRRLGRRLVRGLAESRPDVVLVHSSWSHALLGPVARSHRTPLALWLHAPPDRRHWLDRAAHRAAPDLLVANSRHTAEAAAATFPALPAAIVHPPLPEPPLAATPAERSRLRAELGAPDDASVVVQVSRMEEWKGHRVHLEALGRLSERLDWRCWMIGGGQRPAERRYQRELAARSRELGLGDRVRFLGERHDVPRLLQAADLFCQPNTGAEPFGLVFVEALQAGLPVVASAVGGALEIVDRSCGRLVPPGEPEALAAELEALLADRRLARTLGAAGPARARELCHPEHQLPRLFRALAPLEAVA